MTKSDPAKNESAPERVHVGLLLDESGSMTGREAAVIGGVNEFMGTLGADADGPPTQVSLSMFDRHGMDPAVRVRYSAIPLPEVTPLEAGEYSPRGATPLNDAVLRTIESMQMVAGEADRVMLVIVTDGLENASEASTETVRDLIRRQEAKGWEFIYLGANHDVWAESAKRGMNAPGRQFEFDATDEGVADVLALSGERAASFRADHARYREEAEGMERGSEGRTDTP